MFWLTASCFSCRVMCRQPVEATDDAFWDQFWADSSTSVQDIFALVPAAEIRAVREESPSNLATLCYKVSRKSSESKNTTYPIIIRLTLLLRCICKASM